MKIGVIGSGMIGGTVVRLFAQAEQQVVVANSRGAGQGSFRLIPARSQQATRLSRPGSAIYNRAMTLAQAQQALARVGSGR